MGLYNEGGIGLVSRAPFGPILTVSKVGKHHSFAIYENVARLDVLMSNISTVQEMQCTGEAVEERSDLSVFLLLWYREVFEKIGLGNWRHNYSHVL
jgi:hypothetical protein